MKPHHIGYLVSNIQDSIKEFEVLGYKLVKEIIYDDARKIDICFMENSGYVVELIAEHGEDSVVKKLKKKIGVSPYHICYEVENMKESVDSLVLNGYLQTSEIKEAIAIDGNDVVFLYHSDMGIIELVENKEN